MQAEITHVYAKHPTWGSRLVREQQAKHLDVKKDFADLTRLIRSIQHREGNPECFLTGKEDCSQIDCAWREYCLKSPEQVVSEDDTTIDDKEA